MDVKGEDDVYTHHRDAWTLFDYNKESNQAAIHMYRSIDLRCLYMWILTESKISESYNPGVLKEVLDVLV